MGRRRKGNALTTFEKYPIGAPLVLLILIGVTLVDQYNIEVNQTGNIIGIYALLIAVNIGIFRLFGLHHAYRRTKKLRYWTFEQKCKLTLFLFGTLMMFAPHNIIGGLLYISFFIGLLYFIVRGIWGKLKNVTSVFNTRKRPPVHFWAIDEIDKMSGTQFELFLSKLYDGLGYFSEVTPPSGDFGADVITIKDKTKTVIQAKCYGEGQSVGVEAVNEICGGAGYWNAQKKMVITNRYFTKSAKASAEKNNVKLIDRDGLQLLLREYRESIENNNLLRIFPYKKHANK